MGILARLPLRSIVSAVCQVEQRWDERKEKAPCQEKEKRKRERISRSHRHPHCHFIMVHANARCCLHHHHLGAMTMMAMAMMMMMTSRREKRWDAVSGLVQEGGCVHSFASCTHTHTRTVGRMDAQTLDHGRLVRQSGSGAFAQIMQTAL